MKITTVKKVVEEEVKLFEKGDIVMFESNFAGSHYALVLEDQQIGNSYVKVRQMCNGNIVEWSVSGFGGKIAPVEFFCHLPNFK